MSYQSIHTGPSIDDAITLIEEWLGGSLTSTQKAELADKLGVTDSLSTRYGWFRFSGTKLQFFASEEDAADYDSGDTTKLLKEEELPATGGGATGLSYQITLKNDLDSWSIYASTGQKAILKFTFLSKVSQNGGDYEDTNERGVVRVWIKKPSDTTYVEAHTLYIASNTSTSLDVSQYLGTGANQVKLEAVGEDTGQAALPRVYTVTLTNLSITAPTFNWASVFIGNLTIPFYIGGTINKTLVVRVDGSDYSQTYTQAVGTTSYTDTSFNFTIPHPGQSGVFIIYASVQNSDGTLAVSMPPIQVICVIDGDTGKYMAINNVAEKLTNWVENHIFDYAIYDGGSTSSSVTFTIEKDGETANTIALDAVATATKQSLIAALEIGTLSNDNFTVSVDSGELIDAVSFEVDNQYSYAPTAGAVFQMSPSSRSNSQSNREKIINEVTGEEIYAAFSGMNWSNDGWQEAEDGKVLRLMAGSFCTIYYEPMANLTNYNVGKTLEIDFKTKYPLNFDTVLFSILPQNTSYKSKFEISPDKVAMSSQLLNTADKEIDERGTKFEDGARIHLVLVLTPKAYGNDGYNTATLYVNNVRVRTFTYEDADYFRNDGAISIGSLFADIDIYGMRVYDSALSRGAVHTNYINSLPSLSDKQAEVAEADVFNDDGTVNFEKVCKHCNVLVWERGTGNTLADFIPSYTNQNTSLLNWHVLWRDNPENNIVIRNYPTDGQGTTAKTYRFWNLRGKPDDNTVITYADGSTSVKSFTFLPGYGKCERLTAKLNFASSPQSNKMGSVNSIQDLMTELGITNDDNSRFAIYQRPFAGFSLETNEEGQSVYTFLGLYTIGPDKGDKKTMGTDTDTYPYQLSLEGSDNERQPTQFKVPWLEVENGVTMYRYNEDEEYWEYRVGEDTWEGCWDVNAGNPTDAESIADWAAFANFVYSCSPKIAYFDGTFDELNAQADALKDNDVEYWLSGGEVYYYQRYANKFVPSTIGDGQINLFTQLVDQGYGLASADLDGTTNDELTALFIKARCAKFGAELGNYANEDSLYFSRNWTEWMAGSDNRAKNTYYKKSLLLADGGRWNAWFDDTDTIGPINNKGLDSKGYWVEAGDNYDDGAAVFNADQSRLFLLLDARTDRVKQTMAAMMNAMVTLSGSSESLYADKLYDFFHRYYFAEAQEYFPGALYNAATKAVYENAQLSGITFDPQPIRQALGDYYSAWKRWLKKRIQYMMSKYSFGDYSKDGQGHIVFRAVQNGTTSFDLTPAIWMYPNVASGESIVRGVRTKAGETSTITMATGSDQQVRIKGAHYLQSIGSWYNKLVSGELSLTGRMLRDLILGNADAAAEDWQIAITSLALSDMPSLQNIDLRNITTLAGTLNLSGCSHLRYVYAQGTALAAIALPNGGGLLYIGYPETNQRIELRNFPLLTNENVDVEACATNTNAFWVENCEAMAPLGLLADVIDAQADQGSDHALQHVRVIGFDETYDDSADGNRILDALASLTAEGEYTGLNAGGVYDDTVPKPILQGAVTINANAYEDSITALRNFFGAEFFKLTCTGALYIRFADQAVLDVLLANNVSSDGVGITTADVEKVTSISNWFDGNTEITSFDEFEKFINVSILGSTNQNAVGNPFRNCTSLESIRLPESIRTIGWRSFYGCTALKTINLSESIQSISQYAFSSCENLELDDLHLPNVTIIGGDAFKGCAKVTGDVYLPSLMTLHGAHNQYATVFANTGITSVSSLGEITTLYGYNNQGTFYNCKSLTHVTLPNTLQVIGTGTFNGCSNLEEMNFPASITSIQNYAFNGAAILVEDLSLPNLKSLGAIPFAGLKIKKISNFGIIESLSVNYLGSKAMGDIDHLEHVVLPDTLKNISYAFGNYVNITNINVPQSIETIGRYSFLRVPAPMVIDLPSLTSISGNGCFAYSGVSKVRNLGKITTIPKGVYESAINGYSGVFSECKSLVHAILPNTLISVGSYLFFRCATLKVVVVGADTPPTLESNVYDETPIASGTGYIYVPDASVDAYKDATNWATYADQIKGYTEVDALPETADEGACYKVGDDFYVMTNGSFEKL